MNEELFEKMPIPKALRSLAIPTMLGMLITIIYNLADIFFIGQTGDPNQVAAVSLTMPIFFLLIAIGNIFGIGGSSLISRMLGSGLVDRAKNVSAFCFIGCIIADGIYTVLILLLMEPLLSVIGTSAATIDFTRSYLVYLSYGAIFVVIQGAFSNIVRSEGAAKQAMIGVLIGAIINIVLDPIMITNMKMGVTGAAIATVIGNIGSVIYFALYFVNKRNHSVLSISPRYFQMGEIARQVLMIGLPASLTNFLMAVANVVLNNFLSIYGDVPVAAMGVAARCFMIIVLMGLGLAMGLQPLVGYNYGARNYQRMRESIKVASIVNVVMCGAIAVVLLVFAPQLVKIFIDDPQVIAEDTYMMRAVSCIGPLIGLFFVNTFTFQAIGRPLPVLLLSVARQGIIFIPMLFIGSHFLGLTGVIWAQPLADGLAAVFSIILAVRINKQLKQQLLEPLQPEDNLPLPQTV